MKTSDINLKGKKYVLCFSPRVLKNLQDKTGKDITSALDDLQKKTDIGMVIWLLAQMLMAGEKYAKMENLEHESPAPTEDDLLDFVGIEEYGEIFKSLTQAISNGMSTDIEVKSKNA